MTSYEVEEIILATFCVAPFIGVSLWAAWALLTDASYTCKEGE